jgi:hypothetical protein
MRSFTGPGLARRTVWIKHGGRDASLKTSKNLKLFPLQIRVSYENEVSSYSLRLTSLYVLSFFVHTFVLHGALYEANLYNSDNLFLKVEYRWIACLLSI